MTTVTSYANVVPAKNTNDEKVGILRNFIKGVNVVGDSGHLHHGYNLVDCDVAIIQGWQHQRGKAGAHLQLRQHIVDTQIAKQKYVITADSNLFLYANRSNSPHHYLRYSINGVFPNTGNYCDATPDPARWQQISSHTGIQLEKTKKKGQHVLLCLQRNGGWSMGTQDIQDWIIKTVHSIQRHTDRPILIRPHPGDKKAIEYLTHPRSRLTLLKNTRISRFDRPLENDLQKAWCVVNHNSSSIVGPIIQGYHAFITDPIKSQCAEVAHHNFSLIETPQQFDRQTWLERISMFHWNFIELENGTCWKHMRNYCQ
jgi:hypothetical protein